MQTQVRRQHRNWSWVEESVNQDLIAGGALGALFILLIVREVTRRFLVRYEYRIDSFSVLGPFGRQLFQIRRSEIDSLGPLRLSDRLVETRNWPRSQFSRKIVIRAHMARRPVVISWEGKPIAGLMPDGLKQHSPSGAKSR